MALLNKQTLAAAALGALVAALVLGAVVLFIRRDDNAPIQVVLSTPESSEPMAGSPTDATSSSNQDPGQLQVYISGAVRNPGVYTLQQDDRLDKALAAAGGATAEAALDTVNLARRVKDEEHYHIQRIGETPPASNAAVSDATQGEGSFATTTAGALIDLNVAPADLLGTLPGIGQALADAIVRYREEHGPFQSVEEVTDVPRIGPATYEKIRDLVTVGR